MQFAPVAAPDIVGQEQKWAGLGQTQAQTGLIGAQAALTSAQAGGIPSEIALRQAQAGQAQAQAGLIGAQAGAIPSEIGLRGAQAAQASGAAASSTATAAQTGQDTYAKRLQNLLTGSAINQSGVIGQVPPPPDGSGPRLPIGPAVDPSAAPYIPPEGQGLLRALSPSESPSANVRYVPPQSGRSPTFDTSQGHPGAGAAGLYQFEPATWKTASAGAGVDPNNMSQGNQDRAAWWLAQKTYNDQTGQDLDTDLKAGGHEAQITAALASQWPSITGGSQQNKTGESFMRRLPLTVAHETQQSGVADPGGHTGPDTRANVPTTAGATWPQPPSASTASAPTPSPTGATPIRPVMIPGMPGPSPGTLAMQPGGLMGSPEQRTQFQTQRANNMATIFSSQPDAPTGIQALSDGGYITPAQKQTLLANPDSARNFIAQQLPIANQPTPGIKAQIERDTPLMASDLSKNEANVDAGMKAATDQYNLQNIKGMVAGTPDDLLGAGSDTRLAIAAYAKEFGGSWSQGIAQHLTGVGPMDVSQLQDLQKSFLSNVMSNERTQGVQRIGAMSTQYFAKASPSIDMTKPAVQQITNLGQVAQQMTRDFADASNDFYSTQRDATNDSLVSGPYKRYQPMTALEKQWLSPDSPHGPDVYAAAANLMNGMPPAKAFATFGPGTDAKPNLVNRAKQQEAVAIIKRVDPNGLAHLGYQAAQ